ncbi:hypothetical protein KAJ87_01990 [Candidatus Pacearchaeota archaeon]|nr:hypothetical protein [Candidatus Pacearchaeota archaeon]
MVNKRFLRLFLVGIIVLGVILSIYFVLAAAAAPTDLIIEQNVTSLYDEGVFTVNWTPGGGDVEANYTIYIWMNDNYVSGTEKNNSNFGYSWSNTTEANYTFTIEALNGTAIAINSTTNVSMYVDSTAPLVNWTNSGYNNITYKKNTELLTVNISVGDALSGVENSGCIFDVNGTNETVMVSNGWCNTTQLNLTGLADGNHSIDVWANDTVNSVGVNLSYYVVWVDTTVPIVAFSCSPTSVYATETITCSCSGTDVGSGVSNTSYTASPSTSDTGSYTATCTVTDNAGNSGSSSISYTVGNIKSSTTESSTKSYWTKTYVINDEQFEEGYTKELAMNNQVKIKVESAYHHVGIIKLTETTATINISSNPIQVILSIGEDSKVDVTNDGFYDVYVLLNSIESNKANVTIQKIHEEISDKEESSATTGEVEEEEDIGKFDEEKSSLIWLWIILGIVILIVGGWFLFKKIKK